jgi:hemolysin III
MTTNTQPHKAPMDRMISAPDSNEYFNAISHLIGAILAIAGTVVLITFAALDGKTAHVVAFSIYGATLFLVFLASCLMHFFLVFGRYIRVFGVLDHCAIYLLIAGTYTPFCLTLLRGSGGWWLFGIIWGLAVFWIVIKAVFFTRMSDLVSNISYLSMGWMVAFFILPLYRLLGIAPLLLILAGGIVYSIGAISFQMGRPNPFPPYFGNHEIWHLAVLIGSGLFFLVILLYVLPAA